MAKSSMTKISRGISLYPELWAAIKMACAQYESDNPGKSMTPSKYIGTAVAEKMKRDGTSYGDSGDKK